MAASLPAIKLAADNAVPECTTPDRLMAFVRHYNADLDPRFAEIAALYSRVGEELKVRWDIAFFQMTVETAYLSYKRNGRMGDVAPSQNNFAGIGATGGGEPGERFANVETGVRAHLQHVLMYSGERIEQPVAERTRKVQEWNVLTSWQKGFKRQITFADLTQKWSPHDHSYATTVAAVADRFKTDFCNTPNLAVAKITAAQPAPVAAQAAVIAPEAAAPAPMTLQTAAAEPAAAAAHEPAATLLPPSELTPAEIIIAAPPAPAAATVPVASQAAEPTPSTAPAAAETVVPAPITPAAALPAPAAGVAPAPDATVVKNPNRMGGVSVIGSGQVRSGNPSGVGAQLARQAIERARAEGGTTRSGLGMAGVRRTAASPVKSGSAAVVAPITVTTVAVVAPVKPAAPPGAPAAVPRCSVYTASYGGTKSVIIRQIVDSYANYTVLDVTEAEAEREVSAYIDAYARNGHKIGDFRNQPEALDEAFKLCPEG